MDERKKPVKSDSKQKVGLYLDRKLWRLAREQAIKNSTSASAFMHECIVWWMADPTNSMEQCEIAAKWEKRNGITPTKDLSVAQVDAARRELTYEEE